MSHRAEILRELAISSGFSIGRWVHLDLSDHGGTTIAYGAARWPTHARRGWLIPELAPQGAQQQTREGKDML